MRLGRNFGIFGAVGGALLVAISLWFVGWLFVGDKLLLIRWGAYAAPWLAMLALLAAGLLALGRRAWWAALAFVVALLILTPVLPRFSPARWFATPEAGDLRVMTFNTSDMNSDFGAIARLIVHEHADIILLQQIADLDALKAQIGRTPGHFHYFSFPEHTSDTVILSRFQLSRSRAYDERVTSGSRVTAVATIGRCQIRLWDLHAPHGQYAFESQEQFFADAAAALIDEKLPLVVAGDLNSTEFNRRKRHCARYFAMHMLMPERGLALHFHHEYVALVCSGGYSRSITFSIAVSNRCPLRSLATTLAPIILVR